MAGFDGAWFDELRTLTEPRIAQVPKEAFRPTIGELRAYDIRALGNRFVMVIDDLIRRLAHTRYPMSGKFRVQERHIYTFTEGHAFKRQWNIAFTAGEDSSEDTARIGLGFRFIRHFDSGAIYEYGDLLMKVAQHKKEFDTAFATLGNYVERPDGLFIHGPLSDEVLSNEYQPDFEHDWRFYGRCLRGSDFTDRQILQTPDLFEREVLRVFETIRQARF
jgi:hypothetical protein